VDELYFNSTTFVSSNSFEFATLFFVSISDSLMFCCFNTNAAFITLIAAASNAICTCFCFNDELRNRVKERSTRKDLPER